jgi:hypothetical protein
MATRLEVLERNLTRAKVRYHADAQIRRVLGVFAGALGVQLATGTHDWTWKGALAIGAAAAYATARQIWPTVPWALVLHHVQIQQAAEPAAPPASAVQPPGVRPDPAPPEKP